MTQEEMRENRVYNSKEYYDEQIHKSTVKIEECKLQIATSEQGYESYEKIKLLNEIEALNAELKSTKAEYKDVERKYEVEITYLKKEVGNRLMAIILGLSAVFALGFTALLITINN